MTEWKRSLMSWTNVVKIIQVTNLSTKTNALKIQKKQIWQHNSCDFRKINSSIWKKHLERYVNTVPVFGFKSCRYDLNLIKSYLKPHLILDKEQETSVIKKANDFKSLKFEGVQFLDIMKFLGGATTLDSFLKRNNFFPYEWFDNTDKLAFPELKPYEAFFNTWKQQSSRQRLPWLWEAEKEWVWRTTSTEKASNSGWSSIAYLELLTRDWVDKRNDSVQRLFEVVQQQGCSSNPGGNAKIGSILSYQRVRYL